jgi:hypothetical protein
VLFSLLASACTGRFTKFSVRARDWDFASQIKKNYKIGLCTHQEHSTQTERSGSTSEFSIKLRHLLNIRYGELISLKRVKFVSHNDFF